MAYAFEKIKNQMDNKIDVFGQQQPQGGGAQPSDQPGQGGETKTEASSDVSSGGGAGNGAQVINSPAQGAGTQSGQLALQAAKAKPLGNFKPFETVAEKLSSNEAKLQDEANSYVATQKGKQNYNVANEDIEKALGGDAEVGGKVSGLLTQKTIKPIESYKQTNPYVSDLEQFKSEPGLGSYFRSQYGPGYTRGQAGFDVARLQSDPEFYNRLRGLEGKQQDITKKAASFYDPTTGVEAQVSKYGGEQLEAAKNAARAYLTGQKSTLEKTNEDELKSYQEQLKRLREDPTARAEAVKGGLADPEINSAVKQSIAANPELQKYLTPEAIQAFGLSPADYAKIFDQPLNADMFYDEGEANRFNRINTILGEGGPGKVKGMAPGPGATFDRDKYIRDVIGRGSSANEAANATARARIAEILGIGQGRMNQNLERAKAVNYDDIKNNLKNALVGKYSRQGGDLARLQGVDINKYFRAPGLEPLSEMDFIDANQAADMNAAYEEIMDPRRVQAGRYAEGFNPNNYTFDSSGYENELMSMMPNYVPPPPPPPERVPRDIGNTKSPMTDEKGRILEEWEKALIRGGNAVGRAASTVFGNGGGGY